MWVSFQSASTPKVKRSVLLVERWILARLRKFQFTSVQEVNAAIAPLLQWLNQRVFQKLPGGHASAFAQIDAQALMALPVQPWSSLFAQQFRLGERAFQKIVLQREMTDLGVQRGHVHRLDLGKPATKHVGSALEQLRLPFGDLVKVQFKLLAQIGHGLVLAQSARNTRVLNAGVRVRRVRRADFLTIENSYLPD